VPRFPSYVGVRDDVAWPAAAPAPKGKAAPKPQPAPPSACSQTRYFELREGKSAKFWEITLAGSEHTVRYGRIGTVGQRLTKSFTSEALAAASAADLIESKVAKGYAEASGSS
jgi:DNA ligase-1